jgi:dipeptidase E
MGTIVAIGGGDLENLGTLEIDRYIVEFAKKQCPKALFIPTASDDDQEYIDAFNNVYGEKLECITDTLLLTNNSLSEQEIKHKLLSTDIVYVGGGDPRKMLNIWRKYKVDQYLKQAYEKGTILSGLSAGAMCWFNYGCGKNGRKSDGSPNLEWTEGLGFINASHCPHYNDYQRKGFDVEFTAFEGSGIALEDNCAFVLKNDTFRIIKSSEKAIAFKLVNTNGKVEKIELTNRDFLNITDLYGISQIK